MAEYDLSLVACDICQVVQFKPKCLRDQLEQNSSPIVHIQKAHRGCSPAGRRRRAGQKRCGGRACRASCPPATGMGRSCGIAPSPARALSLPSPPGDSWKPCTTPTASAIAASALRAVCPTLRFRGPSLRHGTPHGCKQFRAVGASKVDHGTGAVVSWPAVMPEGEDAVDVRDAGGHEATDAREDGRAVIGGGHGWLTLLRMRPLARPRPETTLHFSPLCSASSAFLSRVLHSNKQCQKTCSSSVFADVVIMSAFWYARVEEDTKGGSVRMVTECIPQRGLRLPGFPDRYSRREECNLGHSKGQQAAHAQVKPITTVASCLLFCDLQSDSENNSFSLGHSSWLEHDLDRQRGKQPE